MNIITKTPDKYVSKFDTKSILNIYNNVRAKTVALSDGLNAEDMQAQSMDDASPTKWHFAHTSWFFETFILEPYLDQYEPFEADYKILFNSYYEQIGTKHTRSQRGLLTRPTLSEVFSYRKHIDKWMRIIIEKAGNLPAINSLVELGVNHEEQHQELIITDLLHLFSINPAKPSWKSFKPYDHLGNKNSIWHDYEGGIKKIGHNYKGFSFDHEGPEHEVFIRPFKLSNSLVTNREWLNFIDESGYDRPELWLSDGWSIKIAKKWSAPEYWEEQNTNWSSMTVSGMQPLNLDSPVCHISFYEADAFARWAKKRLPTEAEWEVAASGVEVSGNTLGNGFFRPLPASKQMKADSPSQLYGDVWEFTQSSFSPYPGFKIKKGAIGEYNGKFMSNQVVLRGSSCVTPDGHSRKTYRNFFYPHQRWQFTGLRLAEDLIDENT